MLKTEYQIVIIGAGPSGLALAAELKRRGAFARHLPPVRAAVAKTLAELDAR
jgi:2-polyprenyl-6-methoxyphenol hydroxylase-like FAD-dependent oxidoreductase